MTHKARHPEVDAVKWTGSNWHQMLAHADFRKDRVSTNGKDLFFFHVLTGIVHTVPVGAYLVKFTADVDKDMMIMDGDLFDYLFEAAEDVA